LLHSHFFNEDMTMKTLAAVAAVTALLGASASASAWWGPGCGNNSSDWFDDFFGDRWDDFDMNMSGSGHGWGRGYNRYRDFFGYGP
jgi:hypothetical protein